MHTYIWSAMFIVTASDMNSCSSVFNSWYLFSLLCNVYVRRHSVVHCVNNGCFMRSVTSLNCALHSNASFQNTFTLYIRPVVSKPPRFKDRKHAFMHTFSLRSKLFVNSFYDCGMDWLDLFMEIQLLFENYIRTCESLTYFLHHARN